MTNSQQKDDIGENPNAVIENHPDSFAMLFVGIFILSALITFMGLYVAPRLGWTPTDEELWAQKKAQCNHQAQKWYSNYQIDARLGFCYIILPNGDRIRLEYHDPQETR